MFPRWHIILSLIFSLLFWIIFPETAWYNLALIIFGAFFIDFDHYMCAVWKTKKWSLFKAFEYHEKLKKIADEEKKRGIFRKGDFHIFHTVESHALILAMGWVFNPFLYVFIGMLIHSLLDLVTLLIRKEMYIREFFLTFWTRRKIEAKFTKVIIY